MSIILLLLAVLGLSVVPPHTAAPTPANTTTDSPRSTIPRIELRLPASIPTLPNITAKEPFPLIPALNKTLTIKGLPTFAWLNASATLKLAPSWVARNAWLNSTIVFSNAVKQPQLIINATRP